MGHLSALERILLLLTVVMLAYRLIREEWPIGLEIQEVDDGA